MEAGNIKGLWGKDMSTKETMIKKLGSEEAYKAYMKEIGKKGLEKSAVRGWKARKLKQEQGIPVRPITK